MDSMDSLEHPLDWWAYGGYPEVMRQLGCTHAQARRSVKQRLKATFHRTGDPRWKPVGHRGYAQLRRAIMTGELVDNDLV